MSLLQWAATSIFLPKEKLVKEQMYNLTPDHQIMQLHGNREVDYALQAQDNTSFYKNVQERTVLKT